MKGTSAAGTSASELLHLDVQSLDAIRNPRSGHVLSTLRAGPDNLLPRLRSDYDLTATSHRLERFTVAILKDEPIRAPLLAAWHGGRRA